MNAVEKHKADAGPTQGDLRQFLFVQGFAGLAQQGFQQAAFGKCQSL